MNSPADYCFCACSGMLRGSVCWLVCLDQVTRSGCTSLFLRTRPCENPSYILRRKINAGVMCEMLIQVQPESVSFIVSNTFKQHCGEPAKQDIMKKKMQNVVLPHWRGIFCQSYFCSCKMIWMVFNCVWNLIYLPSCCSMEPKDSDGLLLGLEWHEGE